MSTFDYTSLIATGLRLVQKYGRKMTLVQLSSTPADAAKPWQGTATPPAAATDGSLEVDAVFVGPIKSLGEEFLKDVEEVALIVSATDLSGYHVVVDDSVRWNIVRHSSFKPGDSRVLTYMGLKR